MVNAIFATNDEVSRKAGANASATSNVEADILDFMTQAESYINTATLFNWSDAYTGLNVDVKGILKECASNLAAIYVILFDMSGFDSLLEAQTMIDYLDSRVKEDIKLLVLVQSQDFMNGE